MAPTMLLRSRDTRQHVDSEADPEKSCGAVTISEAAIHAGDREAKRACLNGSSRRPRLRPGGPETGSISALLRGHEMRQVYVPPIIWNETQLQILDIEFRRTLTMSEQTAAEQDKRPKESTEGGAEQQSEPGWITPDWFDEELGNMREISCPERQRIAVETMLEKLDIVESPIDEIKRRRVHDNELRPNQIAFWFGGKRVGRLVTRGIYESKSGIPCLACVSLSTISRLRMQRLTRRSNKVRPFYLKDEQEDPYIASVLIGLAQEQLSRGGSTSESKEQVVHVLALPGSWSNDVYFYKAVVPREFLRKLESPSEAVECGKLTVRYLEFDLPQMAKCLWRVLEDHCAC